MRAAILALILATASWDANAFLAAGKATCAVKGHTFVLDVGRAKAPTYVAVVLPDGKILRLRYPPEKIDTLGSQYSKGRVSVQLKDLAGVDGMLRRHPVFSMPGTYRFMMQDANTAEGMVLHRLQCSVTLTSTQLSW